MENQLMITEEHQQNSLRDFLTVIFKHKLKILCVFLGVAVTVTVMSFILPPVFEAKSSLLVKIGREYMTRPEVGDNRTMLSLNQEEVINSEIQILTNQDLLKKVITTVKLDNLYPDLAKKPPRNIDPLDAAVVEFAKKLHVEGVKKSNVIRISFQHKDPQVAARAVNLLVELFKEKHLQVFSDPKSSFLEKQLKEYEQKLAESENSMQAFKQKNRVYALEEQRNLLLRQRVELDTALKNSQNAVSELQKRLSTLKGQMKTVSEGNTNYTQTERDRIIVEAKAKLLTLQLSEQELSRKYTDNNRLVVNVRKEIQLVRDFLKEQEEELSRKVKSGSPVYLDVQREQVRAEAELSAQNARAASLRQQLQSVDARIQSLDSTEKEIQRLKREQSINEKNYQTYADRSEEARISDDMNRLKLANISVIQGAAVPIEPVKPKKLLNVVMGFLFGALAGVGIAFFSEYAAQSFSTPEGVERRLGLPVLTTIPYKEG